MTTLLATLYLVLAWKLPQGQNLEIGLPWRCSEIPQFAASASIHSTSVSLDDLQLFVASARVTSEELDLGLAPSPWTSAVRPRLHFPASTHTLAAQVLSGR